MIPLRALHRLQGFAVVSGKSIARREVAAHLQRALEILAVNLTDVAHGRGFLLA